MTSHEENAFQDALEARIKKDVCVACKDNCSESDDGLFRCSECFLKVVHGNCIGLSNQCYSNIGTLVWKCNTCSQKNNVGNCNLQTLQTIDTKLNVVDDLMKIVTNLQMDFNSFKSARLVGQNNGVPISSLNSALENLGRGRSLSLNSNPGSRSASLKRSANEIKGTSRKKPFNEAVKASPSTENAIDSVNGSVDTVNVPSWIPTRNKGSKPKALITGTSKTSTVFTGVKKREPRRHIYIGRVAPTVTEEQIIDHCQTNGVNLKHIRVISKPEAAFKSFHAVFTQAHVEKIEDSSFWPADIVIGRYNLNEVAWNWLKTLPQEE